MAEASKTLRYGGSFYLFGYFRMLALLVPHLERLGLELRQQILVDKGMQAVSGRATKKYRLFPNTTESILFITKNNKKIINPFLVWKQKRLNLSSKEINELLEAKSNGGGMWSIYTGKNICEQFPTKKSWEKLQKALGFKLSYEKIAQTFHPQMGLTDIWRDIDFYKEKRVHSTQKPLKLIQRLINASSNEGNLIVDPFGGSGSTALAAISLKRKFLIIDKDPIYYKEIKKRVKNSKKIIDKIISP
jgi:site-specific DNA-methyltransferase (adenine-specific)